MIPNDFYEINVRVSIMVYWNRRDKKRIGRHRPGHRA